MGRLKILGHGRSPQARARSRGKLFEAMMIQVLHHYGYSVDRILHADTAEMEFDIAGKHNATGSALFADCKLYETAISASKLQAFFGKYMAIWHKDKRCHGLFIALPGIDRSAREFYREHIEGNSQITALLYEEVEVLKAISGIPEGVSPDTAAKRIPRNMGKPGECFLLYTEKGVFWVQQIISPGKRTPNRIAIFNHSGIPVLNRSTLGYLTKLYPELHDFDNITVGCTAVLQPGLFQDADEIVEIRGGSGCFEYQFPAPPKYFVGRRPLLKELDSFAAKLINKETSYRGIVFEGPSGLGKSSLILASVARLLKMGHFAVAIDSRTASSSRFLDRIINYTLKKFGDFSGILTETDLSKSTTGLDRAVQAIFNIGQILESHRKLLFIFFDQFENIFILPDVLKPIKDLFLKICEKQIHLILCFSWNKDLILSTHGFSGELLEAVTDNSKHMILNTFSRTEIDAFLKKLGKDLGETLTKDLQSFLVEFSQGYPWLLKLLCFHVKIARQSGIPQIDIPGHLLSIEEFFQHDLQKLSDRESISLLKIAGCAPLRLEESKPIFEPQIIQNLIQQKLIVSIGSTVDVYGDIFRDYLNADLLPNWDNYILGAGTGNIIKAVKILQSADGALDVSDFSKHGLPEKIFCKIAKDMDSLGLVKIIKGKASLQIKIPSSPRDVVGVLRNHLRDRLRANRQVKQLLKTLEQKNALDINSVAKLLETWCVYISTTRQGWLNYARILAKWMDIADLALLDKKNRNLIRFDPATEIRERHLLLPKRRGANTPKIQYSPVEDVAIRIVRALHEDGRVNWKGLRKSTIFRALATLEDLEFISRKTSLIKVLPNAEEFVSHPDRRPYLFGQSALQLTSFSNFIEILESHKDKGNTLLKLGLELCENLGKNWKNSTAETIAKIMLDWARHANLAPGVFAEIRKGPIMGWKKKEDRQMSLF
ncbi:MAG: restriction endonuclease [Deltaproteobacteria bacterium]|nr:restriction endonuclease [Deltaproteobacteria bacterium]